MHPGREHRAEKSDGIDATMAWPIRMDGSLGRWRVNPPTLRELLSKGYVKLGGYDENRKTWTILYLGEKARRQIDEGVIQIVGRNEQSGAVEVEYAESQQSNVKTVWHRRAHDSGIYGSSMLRAIVGRDVKFDYPKSIYSVRDAVAAVVKDKPKALVIDFFAGSGTTLHAVEMLNATDSGNRRCILVTNNEVSDDEARTLATQGYRPGDDEWEQHGICRSVTWPRSKYTILGRRSDGTALEGEYLTGKTVSREVPRRFHHIGFVDAATLTTVAGVSSGYV
jgi:adenine-specific DNA-methyltransferase